MTASLLKLLLPAILSAFVVCAGAQPKPRKLTSVPDVDARPSAGRSYAVVIGINRYPHLPADKQLSYARSDAESIAFLLKDSYGFKDVKLLEDGNASLDNIKRALNSLADRSRVGTDDHVLVYFSGHGQTVPLPTGGSMGFLIPSDAEVDLKDLGNPAPYLNTCLSMEDVRSALRLCQARQVLVIADACFSGGMIPTSRGLSTEETDAMLGLQCRMAITAGTKGEESRESSNLGHGVFTYKLIELLRARASGGAFSALPLHALLARKVSVASGDRQHPQVGWLDSSATGDYVFAPHGSYLGHNADPKPNPEPKPKPRRSRDYACMELMGTLGDLPTACTAFSPDGSLIATGGHLGAVRLWDVRTQRIRSTISTNSSSVVTSLSFSPDGTCLAASSGANGVTLWDTQSAEPRGTLDDSGLCRWVAFSTDGARVAGGFGSTDELRVWDVSSGKIIARCEGDLILHPLAFSPDGSFLASANGSEIKLYDAHTWGLVKTLKCDGLTGHITSVAVSRQGGLVACGYGTGYVDVFDASTGECIQALHTFTASSLLAARGLYQLPAPPSQSPQGRSGRSGRQRSPVTLVAFSPDGSTLATAGTDSLIKLWDPRSGELKATLAGHTAPVLGLTFSPDGSLLASCGTDSVRLWRSREGD
jgi:WD40 repeat protein